MAEKPTSPAVRIIEAVLIAGLSALATKLVERLFKEREKKKPDQSSDSSSSPSSASPPAS